MIRISTLAFGIVLASCQPSGASWQEVKSGTENGLTAIFGFNANDVWAVGDRGTALRWNGSQWSPVSTNSTRNLKSVWGASANDVWLVGESGAVLRWNGTSVAQVAQAPSVSFTKVLGADKSVFFCGPSNTYAFDGEFREFKVGTSSVACESLFLLPERGVAALLSVNSERKLVAFASPGVSDLGFDAIRAYQPLVVGVDAKDIWFVGTNDKSALRLSSTSVKELPLPSGLNVYSAWVNSANDVWLGGSQGYIAHFDGVEVSLSAAAKYSGPTIRGLWGNAGEMWAVGSEGWILRRELERE
jgi:hypothetical protein